MMKLANKKTVKIVSLTIAVFFILGIFAIVASQNTRLASVASAESNGGVGVINMDTAVQQYPAFAKAQADLQAEDQLLQKEFADKSVSMSDKEKADYATQLQQRMQAKQQALLVPIYDAVQAAIKATAAAQGLSIVVTNQAVIYGGVDITDIVVKSYAK